MVTLEEMRAAEGHKIRIVYMNCDSGQYYSSYYIQSEDEDEEAAIFIDEHYIAQQADIKSITILD